MKKSGFTLSETLITLAILGIVAAIGIPQVVTMAQQHKSKAIVSKFVYSAELYAQKIIADYNANSGNFSYVDKLLLVNNWDEKLKNYTDNDELEGEITLTKTNSSDKYNSNADIMKITLDINGNKKPNKEGVDIFTYTMKNNGKMVYTGK